MQHYLLPVSVLLETMQGLHATMLLRASLSALPKGWDKECVADVVIVQGTLHTCTISTVEGHLLLQQEAAVQALARMGTLEWTMLPPAMSPPTPPVPGQPPAVSQQAAPDWKAVPLSPELLTTLAHRQKQALLLVGGGKRPEEIARLLQLSLPDVERILEELQQRQCIYA